MEVEPARPSPSRGWGSLSLNRLRELAHESPTFETFEKAVEQLLKENQSNAAAGR
jgi:hypothetical protein